jgi:hypothetical protein
VDGPVQLILHGGKEVLGCRHVGVVVDAGSVDVSDLLIETALAGPYGTDPGE